MFNFLIALITFIFVLTTPALASNCPPCPGAVIEGQTFWQALAEHIIAILVTVLTPVLLVLVNKAIKVFEQKTKIDIADRHEALIQMCVQSGIDFAHEQGRKALKSGAPAVASDEKKIMAVETAASKLRELGIPEKDGAALAKYVEAQLNRERKDPKKKGKMER